MSSEARIPDANALDAASMVSNRIVAAIAYPLLRYKVQQTYPTAAEFQAVLEERSRGYFVFSQARAFDDRGEALGEVPFRDHAILDGDRYRETGRRFSDADTFRWLTYSDRVDLTVDEPGGLGMPDLVEVMPSWLREQLLQMLLGYQRP
jgi:hypothetical protein